MSTKQFVLSSGSKREERDAGSSVSRRFFSLGQTISGTSYFYARCRPGSVTEMTDGSGNVQAQYAFDPFGRSTKLQGGLEADFQYAGYYMHQRSGLYLPVFRAYSAKMGRWISRDPIEEVGGHNLLTYVSNDPVLFVDPTGLQGFALPVEWAWLCSTASGRAVLAWILRMRGGAAAATGAAAACKSCDGPPPKRDPTKPPGSEGGPLGPPTPPTPPPIITPPPGSMPPIGGPIGPIEPPGPIDMTPPPTYPTEPPGHFDPPYEGPMGVPD